MLGYANYRAYLRSPHWIALKKRYRESDEPQDCICGELEGVQLHHLTYERIGGEELSDLTPLCSTCHAMIHELERRGEIGLDFAGFVNAERAARYQELEAERQAVRCRERRESSPVHELRRIHVECHVRLAIVAKLAEQRGVDISTDVAAIERVVDRIERKATKAIDQREALRN